MSFHQLLNEKDNVQACPVPQKSSLSVSGLTGYRTFLLFIKAIPSAGSLVREAIKRCPPLTLSSFSLALTLYF